MTAINRFCELSAGLILAVICAVQHASADTIKLNNFLAGSRSISISFTGSNWHDGNSVASPQAAIDLGHLFTDHQEDVAPTGINGTNESASQRTVSDIVNDPSSYSLDGSGFKATGTGHDLANNGLIQLGAASNGAYTANIWTMQDMISTRDHAQDDVVFAPVPEPQTYAMLLAGLGIIVFTLRRRKQL